MEGGCGKLIDWLPEYYFQHLRYELIGHGMVCSFSSVIVQLLICFFISFTNCIYFFGSLLGITPVNHIVIGTLVFCCVSRHL